MRISNAGGVCSITDGEKVGIGKSAGRSYQWQPFRHHQLIRDRLNINSIIDKKIFPCGIFFVFLLQQFSNFFIKLFCFWPKMFFPSSVALSIFITNYKVCLDNGQCDNPSEWPFSEYSMDKVQSFFLDPLEAAQAVLIYNSL